MKPILVYRDKVTAEIRVDEFINRGQMEAFIDRCGPTIQIFAKIMGRVIG